MSSDREQHVVRITKNIGEERRDDIVAFINKHLAEYKGTQDGGATESSHGIPVLVFKKPGDAHVFANELSKATNYPREHIEVKPRGPLAPRDRQNGKT
jgi:hypothetical protein